MTVHDSECVMPGAKPAPHRPLQKTAAGNDIEHIQVENTGQALLEMLAALGVEYFFANAGSDFAALIDGFARLAEQGRAKPKPILAPQEMCAVSMAAGYHMATGKPPVVMVHSTVGTANATCGLINASKAQVPLVLMAGHPPISEQGKPGSKDLVIHWAQEAFDQGEIVRQFVKWDYRLDSPEQLEDMLRRAFRIAMSEPKGPVYLSMPRDILEQPLQEFVLKGGRTEDDYGASGAPPPRPEDLEQLARWISVARLPMIVTRSFGRIGAGVADLVSLAESFAIAVCEFQIPEHVNFPASNPLHQGYPQSTNPLLQEADLIVAIDCPMPWTPAYESPTPDTRVAHIGVDPLYARYPIRGFRSDLAIAADSRLAVRGLTECLEPYRHGHKDVIERRHKSLAAKSRARRLAAAKNVSGSPAADKSSFAWLSHCLSQAIEGHRNETIVVQEYDLDLDQMQLDIPGSCLGFSPSGGLGFGVGGALGVQLANPDKTVISAVGDGTYILGAADACHMVAAMQQLPILWIVFNNHGWRRLALITEFMHPHGAAARTGNFPLVDFSTPVAFEQMCGACGGYGEHVERPSDVPAALGRALRVVREEKRQALLNVECLAD
jgi:acetolactate synthase-1/2/3 large subunit